MRLAIFSDNFYPELSGISDGVITLARELGHRGHAVRLYVPWYAPRHYRRSHVPLQEIHLGSAVSVKRLFSLPFPTGTTQGRMIIPTGAAWRDAKKFSPEVLHTQSFFGAGIEAWWAAKKLGRPLVGTNHTVVSEFIPAVPFLRQSLLPASLKYVSWYYNQCAVVTAPSRVLLKEMVEYGLRQPYSFLSNPVDTTVFFPDEKERESGRKKFGLSGYVLVYAGRLAPEKNVDQLIQALVLIQKKVPQVTLALAGHGQAQAQLEQLARELGVASAIKFLGTLDKPMLRLLYNASDLFITASTSENQPLTLLQAFACGLPAVGVNARGLGEHIVPTCGKLVKAGSIMPLAEAVATALLDPALRKKWSTGALEQIQSLSAPMIAEQWEKIYQSFL